MKTNYIPKILLFALAIIMLASCSPMGQLYTTVYTPPMIQLPKDIKNIGIVNRSLPVDNKGNKAWTTLEALVTGEGIMEDRNGSFSAISGAEVHFNMDTIVRATQLRELLLPGLGAGKLNPSLSFDIVDSICSTNNFDALLVLESFDSDQRNSQTSYAIRELANSAITGNLPTLNNAPSWTDVFISMNWRLYDNKRKIILDEAVIADRFGTDRYRYDVADFAKRDGIQACSYIGGRVYASRIYPSRVRVYRDFFRRKGPELKMAARMMDVGDLEGAKDAWFALTNHHKRKVAGRACYNTAVGLELEGDMDAALEWCRKSFTIYRIRQARNYSSFLMNRMSQLRPR
jgi:hypothetical protein